MLLCLVLFKCVKMPRLLSYEEKSELNESLFFCFCFFCNDCVCAVCVFEFVLYLSGFIFPPLLSLSLSQD